MYRILKPGEKSQSERFVSCYECGCEFLTDKLGEFTNGGKVYATCPWCHKNIEIFDTWHSICGDCVYCSEDGHYTCSHENGKKVNRTDESCVFFIKNPERRPDV